VVVSVELILIEVEGCRGSCVIMSYIRKAEGGRVFGSDVNVNKQTGE